MTNANDRELRNQLVSLLKGGEAHLDFASVLKDFPVEKVGHKPSGVLHSAWELVEHLRITQQDILQFSIGVNYHALQWPKEYWPDAVAPVDSSAWSGSITAFENDLAVLLKLVREESTELYKPFPHGEGQNWIREFLLVADHNSHHLGQLIFLKKLLTNS